MQKPKDESCAKDGAAPTPYQVENEGWFTAPKWPIVLGLFFCEYGRCPNDQAEKDDFSQRPDIKAVGWQLVVEAEHSGIPQVRGGWHHSREKIAKAYRRTGRPIHPRTMALLEGDGPFRPARKAGAHLSSDPLS